MKTGLCLCSAPDTLNGAVCLQFTFIMHIYLHASWGLKGGRTRYSSTTRNHGGSVEQRSPLFMPHKQNTIKRKLLENGATEEMKRVLIRTEGKFDGSKGEVEVRVRLAFLSWGHCLTLITIREYATCAQRYSLVPHEPGSSKYHISKLGSDILGSDSARFH